MIDCPIKLVSPRCDRCPFGKEGLCDYPHAAGNLECRLDELKKLERDLFLSMVTKTRPIEPGDVWRQTSKN